MYQFLLMKTNWKGIVNEKEQYLANCNICHITADTHPHEATGDTQLLSKAGVSKALASMFSAETPSESSTCEKFHFSLPKGKEPLKPVTCTTPPPLRVARPPSPESEERNLKLQKEDTGGPIVCETPGMSTQGQRGQFVFLLFF